MFLIFSIVALLIVTNPNRSDWVLWDGQNFVHNGGGYNESKVFAEMNPYQSYVLFSTATEKYTTSDIGYIGILGHWIKAMKPTSELTDHGRIVINDPYIGFWGLVYKTLQ
jgi:hypothetical protein